jgi:hypothetical protein
MHFSQMNVLQLFVWPNGLTKIGSVGLFFTLTCFSRLPFTLKNFKKLRIAEKSGSVRFFILPKVLVHGKFFTPQPLNHGKSFTPSSNPDEEIDNIVDTTLPIETEAFTNGELQQEVVKKMPNKRAV